MRANDTDDVVAKAGWTWPPERSPERRPWHVEVDLGVIDDRVECVRLEIRRGPAGGPVTSQALRSIPLRRLVEETIERQRKRLEAELEDDRTMADLQAAHDALLKLTGESRPPGRRHDREPSLATKGVSKDQRRRVADIARSQLERLPADAPRQGRPPIYDDAHYEEVAGVYRQAHRRQQPPTAAVAESWGVNRSTAAGWVRRARRLELLGPTTPRRPGESKRSGR